MRQIVKDYAMLQAIDPSEHRFTGNSIGFKPIVKSIFSDITAPRSLLDIGFGMGDLGRIVKTDPATEHWSVDGIDGFDIACLNRPLFEKGYYRNIWHGLAQELPRSVLNGYDVICLFDVIEHLDALSAKALLRHLLESLAPNSRLALSTPLWFWQQAHTRPGDLEEHQIGIPASSLLRLKPSMFLVLDRFLIGTFVFSRYSLAYLDRFQPTDDKAFDINAGLADLQAMGRQADNLLYMVEAA